MARFDTFEQSKHRTQGSSKFVGNSGNEIGPKLHDRDFVRNCPVQEQTTEQGNHRQQDRRIEKYVPAQVRITSVLGLESDMEKSEIIQADDVFASQRRFARLVDLQDRAETLRCRHLIEFTF